MNQILRRAVPAALAVFLVLPAAQADSAPDETLYRRCLNSAVWVVTVREQDMDATGIVQFGRQGYGIIRGVRYGVGTGSIIDAKQRLILTNAHVVSDSDRAQVFFPIYRSDKLVTDMRVYWKSQYRTSGRLIAKDERRDLAIIQVERLPRNARALPLSEHGPTYGDRIHSIGNAGESKKMWTYHTGTTLDLGKHRFTDASEGRRTRQLACAMMLTDIKVEHGESGSPVFNDRAELVGVIFAKSANEELPPEAYAIDVYEVKGLLRDHDLVVTAAPKERPAKVAADSEDSPEADARRKLKLAKQMAEGQKLDNARQRLREIVDKYPDTRSAREAQMLLDDLDR
jgi:S1-C subfamily serine protease